MIEKLDKHLASNINSCNMSQNIMVAHKAIEKINEIVDLLNAIVVDVGGTKCVDGSKAPADPYAEQRKWIGCVCRFWYDNPNDTLLDYLDKIQTGKNGVVQYYAKESGDWFPNCKPVLPIDNAIYKGGDNE
jgi:hypothetical protein